YFYFKLDETIVSYTDSIINTTKFRNTGSTDQQGIEWNSTIYLVNDPYKSLSQVKLQTSYTYHHFRFKNYVKEGEDFSGNELTGVAPHIFVTTLDVYTSPGFYANLTYNFTDEIPLNDANTVYAPDYHLFDLKLGWEKQLDGTRLNLYGGINNLFDQKYSLGNDLNAFGQRYFQPSPDRNYYLGLKVEI
ncbi:MAG: TonB-dependent receptor domain-containing protein, partial [Candidatus Cyclobacteriaceae bacterium M3_2C_046]